MSEEYNRVISKHYAAYRPPLHKMILARMLTPDTSFLSGLDIGCGTGISTIALSQYCRKTYGVDPSEAMINQTISNDLIEYNVSYGDNLKLPTDSIDIVTFAGSLSYAKSNELVAELLRVCIPTAQIIAYDFEVQLTECLQSLGLEINRVKSTYDHAINFSDYDEFNEITVKSETLVLNVDSEQLAHILLSSSKRYDVIVKHFNSIEPFTLLVNLLDTLGSNHSIKVDVYYSMHGIVIK
ncbi:methyltransferase domain-containing protein [Aliivibrio fischeri]|uniref:class I SAM-dependent methyltransferase n=1 Tax=Aliivibrio fischeri TaxID=668 RepID=UPI0012D8DA94|nr:class I SAM-dependent methyltransferase [Aliivibrio fischeri]MUK91917.1 methyltransferase domain-containing protein [Aliivibrio fischeri]